SGSFHTHLRHTARTPRATSGQQRTPLYRGVMPQNTPQNHLALVGTPSPNRKPGLAHAHYGAIFSSWCA
ncbi:MAG TPA: hypothetical protein VEI49_08555, partial [Terriglobales bacterium]|nr:hypothetical protein [Terriglobales bacterium]